MADYDVIVVGCGLSGAVIARHCAEKGKKVLILERRDHIGGNMYDCWNEDKILVHKYGPHTFHTKKKALFDYMNRFCEWKEYKLTCGAVINGKYTPTPFGFQTIDDYFEKEKAEAIKAAIRKDYIGQKYAFVTDLLESENDLIREFAQFLFDNDYSLYTAKQWGVSPKEIDPSVLKRVPVRLGYNEDGYFDDAYQFMPNESYVTFFTNLLDHEGITVHLNVDALDHLSLDEEKKQMWYDGKEYNGIVVYTGPVDELFGCRYGSLPYRSLRFEWKTEPIKSYQDAPVVAYPQAEGFTRITEYTKLPVQEVGNKTTYAIEYPLSHDINEKCEPYYPVLTEESQELYQRYKEDADRYPSLIVSGRLADFKYYNMDQALEKALEVCEAL